MCQYTWYISAVCDIPVVAIIGDQIVRCVVQMQILEFNNQTILQWPKGNIVVKGADNGVDFSLYLKKTSKQQIFDPALDQPVNTMYQGKLAFSGHIRLQSFMRYKFLSPHKRTLHHFACARRDGYCC